MNKQISISEGSVRLLYVKYKPFFASFLIIVICIILFIIIVVPQIQNIFFIKDENTKLTQRIEKLKANEAILASLSDDVYTNKLNTTLTALPQGKDFVGILNAITLAAQGANVTLGDYSFAVGDLATQSAKLSSQLSLQMELSIDGGPKGAKQFIQAVSQQLPLAEVTNINVSDVSSAITIAFFYKPLPSLQLDPETPIHQSSPSDDAQISQFDSWQAAALAIPTPSLITPTPSISLVPSSQAVISPLLTPTTISAPSPTTAALQ